MQYGRTALMFASFNGRLEIAQELLKHGANTEATDLVGNGGWMHVW